VIGRCAAKNPVTISRGRHLPRTKIEGELMFRSSRNTLQKAAVAASTSAALGLVALAASLVSTNAAYAGPVARPSGYEKCYGVAKAGKNDCAAGAHSCAGQSTQSEDKSSFVYLPSGICEKLAGGSTSPG
jgi:uncharacterized membrane protein